MLLYNHCSSQICFVSQVGLLFFDFSTVGYTLVEVGELLLRNGANPNDGPILFNVMNNLSNGNQNESLKELIYALIDSGADTNRHEKEKPNLILAVGNRDIDLVKKTLENGANINAQDSDGYTCLHSALRKKIHV